MLIKDNKYGFKFSVLLLKVAQLGKETEQIK